MKSTLSYIICNLFVLSLMIVVLLNEGCKKKDKSTPSSVPVLSTASISAITQTAAQCGGNITSDGGAEITARGVCWSTGQTPTTGDNKTTDGTGTGNFTSAITGLTANTTYYARAYATNNAGTAYGSTFSFTTLQNTVTDIDGNVYKTVTIGTQEWMTENLKVTHYRDGTPIPNLTDGIAWMDARTGAWCSYNNDTNNLNTYGRLYNWYTVVDSRNLCPTGWHIPSDAEWATLATYLGADSISGGKLKETGTAHWLSPNTGATNETGFTALPGGYRYFTGQFNFIGNFCFFWTSSAVSTNYAYYRAITNNSAYLYSNNNLKMIGCTVRCVKD
ncbi:MAG: fibrobacter succinogenes major paralogous domain-containing protein [Bacteroidetes bacterium]|nr:fibrobacter succinogenes major paralogous domain-containing protein [Bacteroidota bacterium]